MIGVTIEEAKVEREEMVFEDDEVAAMVDERLKEMANPELIRQ